MNNSSIREPLVEKIYKLRTVSAKTAGDNTMFPADFDYGDDSVITISINEKLPSEGSTCLVYKGSVIRNGEKIRQVIVKEFYPLNAIGESFRNEDGTISFSEKYVNSDLFSRRKSQFIDSFLRQVELSNNEELMEAVVRPECIAVMPGSYSMYIINDMHNADVLSLDELKTLNDKLQALILLSKTMTSLENQGYLLLDLSMENILYINRPYLKQTMFLDVDSVLNENEIADLSMDRVRISNTYKTPQIALFERMVMLKDDFDEWKELYIDKALNSHEIAVLMSYILFENTIHNQDELIKNINNIHLAEKYGISDKLSKKITQFIVGMLNPLEDRRPNDTCEGLTEVLCDIQKDYLYELESRELNIDSCKYISFNIYDSYPVHEYIEDGTISVNIIGAHTLREAFFDVSMTILQMKSVDLNVNVISDDSEVFIEKHFIKNPALKSAVNLYDNKGNIISRYDEDIVDKPLCNLYLRDESFFTDEYEMNRKSVCLFTEDKYLQHIEKIYHNSLVLVLKETGTASESKYGEYIINGRELFKEFTETPYQSSIFNKGYEIHKNYCISNNPKMSEKDILNIYRENPYNVWASIRAAIASCSRKYEKEKGFTMDELVYAEHLSWTAEAILLGSVPPDNPENIMKYAYIGNNDWKDKSDKKHIIHPCIASSKVGKPLADLNWDDLDISENSCNLDNLDIASIIVFKTMKKISETNIPIIKAYYEVIRSWMSENDSLSEYSVFCAQMDQVINHNNIDRLMLTEAIDNLIFKITSEEKLSGISDRVNNYLNIIKALFKPVLDFEQYHDFKKADEDVIRIQMSL